MSNLFAVPGDTLAEVEEFMPSDGTYEREGVVRASNVGDVLYCNNDREVRVAFPGCAPRFNVVGSIVYGAVVQTYDQHAVVELFSYRTKQFRLIPPSTHAVVHISNVRRGFVENVRGEFGVGDWIRAKIVGIQKRRFIRLSTEPAYCGVIKAFCPVCRQPLMRKGSLLRCPHCGRAVKRKISEDYGHPKLPR